MFQAYVEGYQEKLFDQQCLAIHQGYWVGYFFSKHPKPVNTVLEQTINKHQQALKKQKRKNKNIPKPEVDIETFLKREERRMAYLMKQGK